MDFRITLTDRKPYTQYLKKITFTLLILSTVLICTYIFIFGFHINTIIGILVISCAGVVRFYLNKVYFNEPFFMIQNDIIKYRINECKRVIETKSNEISKISINDSTIEITEFNGKLIKFKLGFLPEKYVTKIKTQMKIFINANNLKTN